MPTSKPKESPTPKRPKDESVALLCYDGSAGGKEAIRYAGEVLESKTAVVLTIWEPFHAWVPYDPAAIGTAAVTEFGAESLGLDKAAKDGGEKVLQEGLKLAKKAGFKAVGRLAEGSPWRAIVDVAKEVGADPIVVGARGLSRATSILVGSVTNGVIHHTRLPVLVVHEPEHKKKK
jgi:nucleotide-binding universal stress UspA family protein